MDDERRLGWGRQRLSSIGIGQDDTVICQVSSTEFPARVLCDCLDYSKRWWQVAVSPEFGVSTRVECV